MDMHLDLIETDAAMFDPDAFGIDAQEAKLNTLARQLGRECFAPRAADYDREARFPTENYRDLRLVGLLGLCVPRADGGIGAGYRAYCTTAAEIGRYCAATALTWNMHTATCLWTGALADDLEMTADERAGARTAPRAALPAYRRGWCALCPTLLRRRRLRWRDRRGAVLDHGDARAGRLEGQRAQDLRLALRRRRLLRHPVRRAREGEAPSRKNTMYIAVPAGAPGVEVTGDWDPLGMRATVSRTILFKDVFVDEDAALMPPGIYFQAAQRWPHMFLTLTPTYVGLAQAAFDFTVRYLRGEIAGPRAASGARRPSGAVAEMFVMLQQLKALWFQVVSEARVDPARAGAARARHAVHRDGAGQRDRPARAAHLRRPRVVPQPAARTHRPRQPLRLGHAAVDRRDLPRTAGPRNALPARRARLV